MIYIIKLDKIQPIMPNRMMSEVIIHIYITTENLYTEN